MVGIEESVLFRGELSQDLRFDALYDALAFIFGHERQSREPSSGHLGAGGLHQINQQLEMVAWR